MGRTIAVANQKGGWPGVELARLAFPFFLVLPPRREHWAFLRCPQAGQRTWIRPHLRL